MQGYHLLRGAQRRGAAGRAVALQIPSRVEGDAAAGRDCRGRAALVQENMGKRRLQLPLSFLGSLRFGSTRQGSGCLREAGKVGGGRGST